MYDDNCVIIPIGEDVSSPLSAYMTVMSVERLVPCPPFDLNSTHSSDEILYDFIFEHAVPRQAKLLTLDECLLSGSSLDTVPDLTLASLSHSERLSVDDVTMDVSSASRLGRGSFANVFPGYIGNEKVAFKIFGDVINLQLAAQHDQPLEQLQQMQQSHEVASPVVDENRDVHIFSFDDRTSKEGREEVGNELSNVKKLRLPPLGPLQYFKNLRDLVQEVSVMKRLQHTHIARFRAVLLKPYPCLVMEFAPAGNLATLITKRRDEIGTVTDLLTGDHFSDRAHDGIVGRQLTHRIAFQVYCSLFCCWHARFRPFVRLFVCLSVCLSVRLFILSSFWLYVCLFICLCVVVCNLCVCLLSVCLPVCL